MCQDKDFDVIYGHCIHSVDVYYVTKDIPFMNMNHDIINIRCKLFFISKEEIHSSFKLKI